MLALKDRLFYKQAKYALILILLYSLLFSFFQMSMDWKAEKKNIEHQTWSTLHIIQNAATVAAYTLDRNLADQVVSGLMRTQNFYHAQISDDLGNLLARRDRAVEPLFHQWIIESILDGLTRKYDMTLLQEGRIVGELWVALDATVVLSNFIHRNLFLVTTVFISAFLLGLAMLLLFFLQTSQPLFLLIEQLASLEKSANEPNQLEFQSTSRSDEFGVLSRTFTALWHKRKVVENELAKSEAYFKAVLHQSSECMLLTDLNGRIHDCNEEACRLLNYDKASLLKLSLPQVDSLQPLERLKEWSQGEVKIFETQYVRRNGHVFPVEVRGNIVKLGKERFFLASVRDITQRKKDQEQMNFLAYYDALTSLPNRRFLNNHLDNVVELACEKGFIGALLFIDLDRFKAINDSMGHLVGDSLLVEVAKRILEPLSKTAVAARIGGDEFVVLLPELATTLAEAQEKVTELADVLLRSLERVFIIDGADLFISASIGISLFPLPDTNKMNILQRADTAMYQAKENGRNGYFFYHIEMQQQVNERVQIEHALRTGLENNEFYMVYQPQVNDLNETIGFEALLRWNSHELGVVSPDRFIPITEETGLINPLGLWVMKEAFTQLKAWQDMGIPACFQGVAINISPYQFSQEGFVQQVLEAVSTIGVDPRLIDLEITEGLLVKDIPLVTSKMQMLKDIGIRFSIDDFGTAYSSLRYLQHFPLDQLKIDQSFIRDLTDESSSQVIVNTIVSMANHMQLSVLAEGVETRREKNILLTLGCTRFQGYHFARPLDKEAATEYLYKNTPMLVQSPNH
ncbi:putative bifunctional diguanylate cyclase/phosphodiesterase [Marinomonas algicola]|uniref:putative bifunctional diguanylate cyclase/phosphodiesterase n=1 Tax=Marinomonas algicola TaxID=2773454 RepID=UPI00174E1467|nr:EAL domain-containing protein [Marinomonas algicola]